MTKRAQRPFLYLIFFALLSIEAMGQTESTSHQTTPSPSPAGTHSQSPDLSQLDEVNYVNDFFRVSLSIPREWVVATAQRRAEFDKQIKEMVKAPAREFGVADVKVTSPYGTYRQRIYITMKGDYALEMFFTYLNDSDLPVFDEIVKSVRFK